MAANKVEISTKSAEHTESRTKYVTAASFEAERLIFGDFESKPVGKGKDATNFESIPIKYRYSDDPSDQGQVLKWATPVMVSPRGFSTRSQNGKIEWSYMVVYSPDEDPDWDEETTKRAAEDPAFRKQKESEWAETVSESKRLLEEEAAALNELTDAAVAHVEGLKDFKKYPKLKTTNCIRNFHGDAFVRLPYSKEPDAPTGPHYTAWMKLMEISASATSNGKPAIANVAWSDGEPIPKFLPKGVTNAFTWRDLMEKRLTVETLQSIRNIYFGKVNKIQTSAVSVMIHTVKEAEAFDPLQSKAKAVASDKEKSAVVSRNKARLQLLKESGPAFSEEYSEKDEEGEKKPSNMCDDEEEELPRRGKAAPAKVEKTILKKAVPRPAVKARQTKPTEEVAPTYKRTSLPRKEDPASEEEVPSIEDEEGEETE